MTHRHTRTECLTCGSGVDAASAVEGDLKPEPGDLSICLYCGQWLMFNDAGLPVLIPTAEEMEQGGAELRAKALEIRQRWNERWGH